MSNKKDLTRIEDLSEYLHEITSEDSSDTDFTSEEVPELPSDDFTSSFETSEEEIEFTSESDDTVNDETPSFTDESTDFTSDFNSEPEIEDSPLSDSFEESTFETPSFETENIEETKFSQEPIQAYKAPENFSDLKKFSESSSFSGMSTEGNPSFSMLIKNIRFIEDVNDILTLLKELKLLTDSEEQVKGRLMRGTLLVPRISEYAAIYLGHKLRRFDIDIEIGLSDEIHPPKHQEAPETGIVSKRSLYQNQGHHFNFDHSRLELSDIIVAATPALEGYQVLRYQGVASEHMMLDSNLVEDENSDQIPLYYHELAQKLKAHALKVEANAVVGLNYQLTPIPSEFGGNGHKYRLTCTGNLVWVNKL